MNILTTIEYLVGLMAVLYLIGMIVVLIYDFKKNSLYRNMRESIRDMEGLQLSMAVMHARTYMVMENYRRDLSMVEKVQQFILENMFFVRRRTLKS